MLLCLKVYLFEKFVKEFLFILTSKFHLDSKNELFFVGQPTGSKIEFDGNELIMSSSAFSLGSEASAFVSGF